MSTAEYENHMSPIGETSTPEQLEAFRKVHQLAKTIHTSDMGEIERFKSIMDKLMNIESDIFLIKKHFNIVHIFDVNKKFTP